MIIIGNNTEQKLDLGSADLGSDDHRSINPDSNLFNDIYCSLKFLRYQNITL